MRKLRQSLSWAKNGLKAVWIEERNFRIEINIAVFVVVLGILKGISKTNWLFIFVAIGMVLCSEIINTAIEDICNKIEPNQDPVIGKIKDIMAGFVLVSCIVAILIGLSIFL